MCKHFVFSFLLKFVLKFLRLGFKIFWFLTTKLLWLDNVMEIFNRFFLCCDDLHFHIKETGKQNWQISRQLCLTRFTHLYLFTLKLKEHSLNLFIQHSGPWSVWSLFEWSLFYETKTIQIKWLVHWRCKHAHQMAWWSIKLTKEDFKKCQFSCVCSNLFSFLYKFS